MVSGTRDTRFTAEAMQTDPCHYVDSINRIRAKMGQISIRWLVTLMTLATTCSVAVEARQNITAIENGDHGGILRADLGLYLKELGTVVATTDHVFINIAAEVPKMDLDIAMSGIMDCMNANMKSKEKIFDCHASNAEYQDYKKLLLATRDNIWRDLEEVEESLQGQFRISMNSRPKRAIIPILWGLASAAFGISGALFAHRRRVS